jgi:2,4-dienoyl-CoA reductase-like NADH-dependent reductase (Old Yellow Enzyme family)
VTDALEPLRAPIALGPVRVGGRVVSTSHQTSLVHDHLPTDDLVAYHEARAAGGVAAVFLEAAAVHHTGLLTPHTIGGYLPQVAARYRALARAVGAHGTRTFVQLFHGGREQFGAAPRPPAVAPSAVPSPRFKSEPRALTARELSELVAGYATAARLAREGELDGIELSFSHGYLVAQFLSPQVNRRTDGYGGGQGARLRLAREVIAAVRDAAGPELAVGVRLSADELGPGMLGRDACARIGSELCDDGGIDFVSLALGNSATYEASTWIAPPPPVAPSAIADHISAIRAAVSPTPVIAATRVVDLADAAALVTSGAADLVGMTRALIADPELVRKATAGGEPVIECIGCNQGCIGHYHQGVPIACAVNPRTGRERRISRIAPRDPERRVVVIGGGPAGVAAALEAARGGHRVTLHERADRLGGQLALAGRAPAHHEVYARWERTVTARLAHGGVDVRLGSELAEPPGAERWDVCVLATGARPYRPPPAADRGPGPAVTDAWTAIARPESVIGPVLVADWGGEWSGLDAAECLRDAGHEVTLACAATHPGETLHQYQRNLYLARLDEAEITILHHAELVAEDDGLALRHVFSGRRIALPQCATLVIAHGRAPADELWPALEPLPGAVRAGDVLSPRSIEEAVLEGTAAVAVPAGPYGAPATSADP